MIMACTGGLLFAPVIARLSKYARDRLEITAVSFGHPDQHDKERVWEGGRGAGIMWALVLGVGPAPPTPYTGSPPRTLDGALTLPAQVTAFLARNTEHWVDLHAHSVLEVAPNPRPNTEPHPTLALTLNLTLPSQPALVLTLTLLLKQ